MKSAMLFLCCTLAGCAAEMPSQHSSNSSTPTTQPAVSFTEDSPEFWKSLTAPLHGTPVVSSDSFAVIIPRDDIDLESEMGQVPTTAGIESRFYFWRCHCGKVKVMGEFLACDYESDDVLHALLNGGFTVDSVAPILQNTRPNIVCIRFQSEGDGEDLVDTLKEALGRTGPHHSSRELSSSTTQPDDN